MKAWKWILLVVGMVLLGFLAALPLFLMAGRMGISRFPMLQRFSTGMPMMRFFPNRVGWFGWGGLIACLVVAALIVLIVVLVVQALRKSRPVQAPVATPAVQPAAVSTPVAAAVAAEAAPEKKNCPSCGQAVEPDWVACPHCGTKL